LPKSEFFIGILYQQRIQWTAWNPAYERRPTSFASCLSFKPIPAQTSDYRLESDCSNECWTLWRWRSYVPRSIRV